MTGTRDRPPKPKPVIPWGYLFPGDIYDGQRRLERCQVCGTRKAGPSNGSATEPGLTWRRLAIKDHRAQSFYNKVMSRTYKATGINLKAVPMGESDRLLTVLTPELGLVRAIAPGSRKHRSQLGGRSGLFVINQLLLAQGKQLDKITQAETVRSFPKLSQDLGKLTAGQYLAELALFQALSGHPQEDLYHLLIEHLERIEAAPSPAVLPCLTQGIYHLLALAGVAPNVRSCCVTRQPIIPDLGSPDWRVGFSAAAGGIFQLSELGRLAAETLPSGHPLPSRRPSGADRAPPGLRVSQLTAMELVLLQQLSQPELLSTTLAIAPPPPPPTRATGQSHENWTRI